MMSSTGGGTSSPAPASTSLNNGGSGNSRSSTPNASGNGVASSTSLSIPQVPASKKIRYDSPTGRITSTTRACYHSFNTQHRCEPVD